MISGELEILSVKILHLDKTIPPDFISNCLQEFVNYTDVLPALWTDHSPVLISLSNANSDNNSRGLGKYNSSLAHEEVYVENMKKLITNINT